MKTVTREFVESLIDFAPTEETKQMGFAESQLEGAVAGFNMLARNRVAYVADEVGMGKTYVALGIMGLLRYLKPDARIVVLAPRENIQLKWIKELQNFVRQNWKLEDNRVRNLRGGPVWQPVPCRSIDDLAQALTTSDHHDLFLRNTTFSASVKDSDARKRIKKRLQKHIAWLDGSYLDARASETAFRDHYGRVLNAIMPEIDLLVVDEGHNFKKGFGPRASNRNRVAGMAFGHPDGGDPDFPFYGHRINRLLVLSATPFEYDYQDLYHQLDVFGMAGLRLSGPGDGEPIPVSVLNGDAPEEDKREAVQRFLVRRVSYLNVGDKKLSKNLYRREWRFGGYEEHDNPMSLDDPEQRLVVGLIQKKVSEILGDKRFGNSFQIGMLSSFESFLESMGRKRVKQVAAGAGDEAAVTGQFDGDQTDDAVEKQGIDTHSLEKVVRSYRDKFGKGLPHPKLDATAASLRDVFETGEKALVFVRRVATTGELKARLDRYYDEWMREKFERELPESMQGEVERVFADYEKESRWGDDDGAHRDDDEDRGGKDSFFSWFFRGDGPRGWRSGAAFGQNSLRAEKSPHSTFFDDNHVLWLLGYPDDPVAGLATHLGIDKAEVADRLRREAWEYFCSRTQQEGFPHQYVFEAYQVAGLRLMLELDNDIGLRAQTVIDECYEDLAIRKVRISDKFPGPEASLGVGTFFTSLVKREVLRRAIWPEETRETFRDALRRREQRRELLSSIARLGHAYIDLYLLAIGMIGTMESRGNPPSEDHAQRLIDGFLDLLERQMAEPRMHAYRELAAASETFDVLMAVNFHDAKSRRAYELATVFGRALQAQRPVARMHGGVASRVVRQFRMPGYPLVMITTDVLQEGEDLHTFCKRVIHYGITWTPSAMEQRTGRVDRINSLVQRNLDGRSEPPTPDELIQVFFPHLEETVERLQVCRVVDRLNRFIRMIHESLTVTVESDSRINVGQELLRSRDPAAPIKELLRSAFPVDERWLDGELTAEHVEYPDIPALEARFRELCEMLIAELGVERKVTSETRHFQGRVGLRGMKIVPKTQIGRTGVRQQAFELMLRSQSAGDATLLRCVSPIGLVGLDADTVDELYELQQELGGVRLCIRESRRKEHVLTIELDRLFRLDTTQPEEVVDLVTRVVRAADEIESRLLDQDAPWEGEEARLRLVDKILGMLEKCCADRSWTFDRIGDRVDVTVEFHRPEGTPGAARHQTVTIQKIRDEYVLRSGVLDAAEVTRTDRRWRELAIEAWTLNAEEQVVSFAFDDDDAMIGQVRHPAAYLDPEELEFYIAALAAECDRMEYLLSGEDAY